MPIASGAGPWNFARTVALEMPLPRTQAELDLFLREEEGKPGFIREQEVEEAEEYLRKTPPRPPLAPLRERLGLVAHQQVAPQERSQPTMLAPQDVITIQGSAGGFPAEVAVMIGAEDWENPDYIASLTARLESIGFAKPIAPPAPARPASSGGNSRPAASADGEVCPVHGAENIRAGFRGRGVECGAYADTRQEWSQDKPYRPANGKERWYCAWRKG